MNGRAAAVLLVLLFARPTFGQVVLRGGDVLDDAVISASSQGVVTLPRLGSGAERTIPWDLIREVRGEHADAARPFTALAADAWRARWRLARGDTALAEPLLAALFEKVRTEDGPTTLRIAEGLLRCRLARADQAGAIEPWLSALRNQAMAAGLPAESAPVLATGLRSTIDAETGLVPSLPPIWINVEATAAFAGRYAPTDDAPPSVRELARLFARSAALDSGITPPTPMDAPSTEPGAPAPVGPGSAGIDLVRQIVASREADPKKRAAARDRLASGLAADADTWREAWRRAALGRSLLMEQDAALRSEGLIHLLHLPARFSRSQPYLAGLAAVEAAAELKRRGDRQTDIAVRLIGELKAAEPLHPALGTVSITSPFRRPSPKPGAEAPEVAP